MRNLLYLLLPAILFLSCDSKSNEATADLGFTKIVGSNEYTGKFYPWDVKEAQDKGFISLTSSNSTQFKNILITKINEYGDLEWEITDSSAFVNPVGTLFENNGNFYFFAMEQITLTTHLIKINTESKSLEDVKSYEDFLFPLAANEVPGGYIIECFDRDANRVRLMKLNENFEEEWKEFYRVSEDPTVFNDHLSLESPLPFFCGYVGDENSASSYFFGGMYRFTLTTCFVDINDGTLLKRLSGFSYDAGVSGLINTTENKFLLTKYSASKETSVLRDFEINIDSVEFLNSQTEDIPDNIDYEISYDARVVLKKLNLNEKELIVHATESKNQETILNFYNSSNIKVATKRIGIDSAYLLGNLTETSDGGLMILCHTFIAGRISRLVYIKIPKEEIEQLF